MLWAFATPPRRPLPAPPSPYPELQSQLRNPSQRLEPGAARTCTAALDLGGALWVGCSLSPWSCLSVVTLVSSRGPVTPGSQAIYKSVCVLSFLHWMCPAPSGHSVSRCLCSLFSSRGVRVRQNQPTPRLTHHTHHVSLSFSCLSALLCLCRWLSHLGVWEEVQSHLSCCDLWARHSPPWGAFVGWGGCLQLPSWRRWP